MDAEREGMTTVVRRIRLFRGGGEGARWMLVTRHVPRLEKQNNRKIMVSKTYDAETRQEKWPSSAPIPQQREGLNLRKVLTAISFEITVDDLPMTHNADKRSSTVFAIINL